MPRSPLPCLNAHVQTKKHRVQCLVAYLPLPTSSKHSSSGQIAHEEEAFNFPSLSSSLEWGSWWVLELAEQHDAVFGHLNHILYSNNCPSSLEGKPAHWTGASHCQGQPVAHSMPQSQRSGPLNWASIGTLQFLWQHSELPFVIYFAGYIICEEDYAVMTESITDE